ncbi:NINE protein [Noviherbaspirillum sedimenti]|uniref:TM2 domain-containing protein n=1 Tax=Noviherbaspirillum sedimenti TaxID=2320865 RepID=A0A3A3GSK4_9BURK|nr:TM2 domain-containing protein [Noviherbaspirillum sedimenti]RJG03960.1 TM2 domain-containing protein [Noviherbaspirillum sedimenti]
MAAPHKNKTFATLLALLFGGIGLHRFYLHGISDRWGWLHLSTLALSGIAVGLWPEQVLLLTAAPLVASILAGIIMALVLGLTPDEKWDQTRNPQSGKQSHSGGWLAVVLVLTTGIGAIALIAVLARALDLLFTGGAYG